MSTNNPSTRLFVLRIFIISFCFFDKIFLNFQPCLICVLKIYYIPKAFMHSFAFKCVDIPPLCGDNFQVYGGESVVCDGVPDCFDGTDEAPCGKDSSFRCLLFFTLPQRSSFERFLNDIFNCSLFLVLTFNCFFIVWFSAYY